jgi:hypothetical protein
MDKPTEKQRADIQKMSTTRLIIKLTGVGMEELEIEALDRNGLTNAWAKFVLAGKDKPVSIAPRTMPTLDPAYSKQLLELEVRKFDAEEKRREIEYQERLKVLELEETRRQEALELEEKRRKEALELEERRIQDSLDLEREKLRLQQLEIESRHTPVHKAKLFRDALKNVISRMPTDSLELTCCFKNIERLFRDFNVEPHLRAHLLKPRLSEKARTLISRIDAAKSSDYEEVKKLLLREYGLNASSLLERYYNVHKQTEEMYVLYGNRLKTVFSNYVVSRKVSKFDELIDLIVYDRVKQLLPENVLKHILTLESQRENAWLQLNQLLSAIDVYMATHFVSDQPRRVDTSDTCVTNHQNTNGCKQNGNSRFSNLQFFIGSATKFSWPF